MKTPSPSYQKEIQDPKRTQKPTRNIAQRTRTIELLSHIALQEQQPSSQETTNESAYPPIPWQSPLIDDFQSHNNSTSSYLHCMSSPIVQETIQPLIATTTRLRNLQRLLAIHSPPSTTYIKQHNASPSDDPYHDPLTPIGAQRCLNYPQPANQRTNHRAKNRTARRIRRRYRLDKS